jgi:hypothetical protein
VIPAGLDTSYYTYEVYVQSVLLPGSIAYNTQSADIAANKLKWGATTVNVIVKYTFGNEIKYSSTLENAPATIIRVLPKSGSIIQQKTQGSKSYTLPSGTYNVALTWNLVGGGGAGGSSSGIYGGGSGGGGGYSSGSASVAGGSTITITTGAGGALWGGDGGGSTITGGGLDKTGKGGQGAGNGHTDGWVGNNHPGRSGQGGAGDTKPGNGGYYGNYVGNGGGGAPKVDGGWAANPEYGRSGAGQGNGADNSGTDGHSEFSF